MSSVAQDLPSTLGLTQSEYERIIELLGREPTQTELGMFSVQWSEHCSYKSSLKVLKHFKKYREAVEGEGLENAGVIDIGNGLGVVMKIESHNHPSAVEPFQGAATGVGGIIRDILTMGARPVAALNSLRFGPIVDGIVSPEKTQRNRYLFEHVVAGISHYGNCVGVPTIAGEVAFHPLYSGNPLVNAMAVGLVPLDSVTTAGAAGIGNPVLYLGSSTGKDGIHGASFASEVLDEDSDLNRPNVQIGDPFAEKILIEATLEALATGAVQSIQDMGAAGLTCSTTEMSSKGGVGMDIDLDLVPVREPGMSAYELMLSESQERMLCVAHLGREHEVIDVFNKWGLNAVVVGQVTDSGRVRVTRLGALEVDAPSEAFTEQCPVRNLPESVPARFAADRAWTPDRLPAIPHDSALMTLLKSPSLTSKRWVFEQYDYQVQTQTSLIPGLGDAAVLIPRGLSKGLSFKVDGNSRWTRQDPFIGGQLAVVEAARNVACTGAVPCGATDGLNFGNPTDPETYWEFSQCVQGIALACEALGTPVVSGNVSFYNESPDGSVPPTAMIGVMGTIDSGENRSGSVVTGQCDIVAVSYEADRVQGGLGASAFLAEIHGLEAGCPEPPDLAKERALFAFLAHISPLADAIHDVSEGGAAFALSEMIVPSGLGCSVDLSQIEPDLPDVSALFGEFPGLVFIGCQDPSPILSSLPPGFRGVRVGCTNETGTLTVVRQDRTLLNVPVIQLQQVYEGTLSAIMTP